MILLRRKKPGHISSRPGFHINLFGVNGLFGFDKFDGHHVILP